MGNEKGKSKYKKKQEAKRKGSWVPVEERPGYKPAPKAETQPPQWATIGLNGGGIRGETQALRRFPKIRCNTACNSRKSWESAATSS